MSTTAHPGSPSRRAKLVAVTLIALACVQYLLAVTRTDWSGMHAAVSVPHLLDVAAVLVISAAVSAPLLLLARAVAGREDGR